MVVHVYGISEYFNRICGSLMCDPLGQLAVKFSLIYFARCVHSVRLYH